MTAVLGNQEVRTEVFSESSDGAPVKVALDHTTVSDVTHIHIMTVEDVIDSVWLEVFNQHTASIDLSLILNPTDTSSATPVDDATVTILIRPKSSLWVLQGQRFRLVVGNTYTLAAYVATADINLLKVTGWINRQKSTDLTA